MTQSQYSEMVVYPTRFVSLSKIIHSHKHLPIKRKFIFSSMPVHHSRNWCTVSVYQRKTDIELRGRYRLGRYK